MEHKGVTLQVEHHEPNEDETDEVTARFATFNVIDHDGGITCPGAFGRLGTRRYAWGHNQAQPIIGRVAMRDAAPFDGEFSSVLLGTRINTRREHRRWDERQEHA